MTCLGFFFTCGIINSVITAENVDENTLVDLVKTSLFLKKVICHLLPFKIKNCLICKVMKKKKVDAVGEKSF